MKLFLIILLSICLVSCNTSPDIQNNTSSSDTPTKTPEPVVMIDDEDMFTERDLNTDYSNATEISLNGDVKIEKEGTFLISGTANGQILVDAKDTDKIHLVLNGVNLTSQNSAPVYVKNADKVIITLVGENTLTTSGEFEADGDNNIDGVVFSKSDLSFNGEGALKISTTKHGIVVKDDLVFAGGEYTINSPDHAIDANDSVRIKDSVFSLTSNGDGIHCENEEDSSKGFVYLQSGVFNITSDGDGISASSYLKARGGEYTIISGGGFENAEKNPGGFGGNFGGGFGGNFGGNFEGNFGSGKGDMGAMTPPDMNTSSMQAGGRPSGSGKPNRGDMPQGDFGNFGEMPNDFSGEFNGDFNFEFSEDNSVSAKAIKATGAMVISGGVFNINAQDDAIHSNLSIEINGGEFNLQTGDDGIHADETLVINSGEFTVSESYEGLEALHLTINDGNISVVSSDDGLNAAGGIDQSGFNGGRGDRFQMSSGGGSVTITAGEVYLKASGDGIDANGTLEISGGSVIVCGPTTGDTSVLDFDETATITNATFIGTGSINMAQTFTTAQNGLISLKTDSTKAGTEIILKDENGNTLVSHKPEYDFEILIISTPQMVKKGVYTLTIGDVSEQVTAK